MSELFPLSAADYRGTAIRIETQLDRAREERDTKTRKERTAFVIKDCREWLAEWLAVEDKLRQRSRQHAAVFKTACRKAFPTNREKHLVFHDLRHSYAVHMLQVVGAPIHLVANSLGNSVHVCEKYYAGFVLTDSGLAHLERLSTGY